MVSNLVTVLFALSLASCRDLTHHAVRCASSADLYSGVDDEYVPSWMATELLSRFQENAACSASVLKQTGVLHDDPMTSDEVTAMGAWLDMLP